MSQNVAECRNNALLPPIELHNFIKYNHLRLAGPGYGACTCCAGMTPLLPAGAFQPMPMARLSTREINPASTALAVLGMPGHAGRILPSQPMDLEMSDVPVWIPPRIKDYLLGGGGSTGSQRVSLGGAAMIRLIEQIDIPSGSLFSYIDIITDRSAVPFTARLAQLCDQLGLIYAAVKRKHGSASVWCCLDRAREVPLASHARSLCSSIDATVIGTGDTGVFERHFISLPTKQSPDFDPVARDRSQYRHWLIRQLFAGWKNSVERGSHGLTPDDLTDFHAWVYKESPIWKIERSGEAVMSAEPLPEPEENFVDWGRLVQIHAPERLEDASDASGEIGQS